MVSKIGSCGDGNMLHAGAHPLRIAGWQPGCPDTGAGVFLFRPKNRCFHRRIHGYRLCCRGPGMSAVFSKQLEIGQLGESVIARWCMSRGNSVIPVYEKEIITGKGPRFFSPQGQFVAPDMFILPSMTFIEAKHKTVFSWHRITGRWCTGIDLNHYEDYQKVQAITGRPVWLLFLHRCSIPDK